RGQEKHTTITGKLEEWETWFLGKDKKISAGHFYSNVLARAIKELEQKLSVEFFITTQKRGRKVVGYEITITDTKTGN
ncbi:replication initiation protein, partial [Enterococcus faecalis]